MKKKILIGFIMDGKSGGIDKYLLNLLENIWTEDLQIDFLSNEVNAELETYLKKYHSTIYPIANLVSFFFYQFFHLTVLRKRMP